jgi:predicted porin
MKRKLLPLLIAGMTAATANVALAGAPTVYGKINVTLNKYDFQGRTGTQAVDNLDDWQLESNASRLGVKGDFDITEGLKAIYKLEYEVFVDDGQSTGNTGSDEFNQRNIYGGLQGSWGSIIAGKNDSPLKLIQTTNTGSEIDRFNDLPLGDIKNIMIGENRESNIIMYTTPNLSGFSATLAIMPGEESGISSATSKNDNDGIADRTSLAVSYGDKIFYAAIAADRNVQNSDTIRAAGEVTLGPVKVGALYQTAEVHDKDPVLAAGVPVPGSGTIAPLAAGQTDFLSNYKEQDAWLLGGEWKIAGPWKLKAQYGQSESTPVTSGLDDTELKLLAVGVDYKLNDNSKVFAYYASVEGDGDSAITNDTIEDKTYAVGYELKF